MNCAEAEALFVDAGDGRLDLSQEVRLAGHLDGCSGCRERAVVWRRLVPGMRGLAPEAPDAMRVRRMQIEIERRLAPVARAPHGSRERWVRWSAALVFASAAALAVLWIRRPADRRIAQAETGYGIVAHVDGELTAEGRRLAPDSHLGADSHLALAAGRADLKLGRNARVRLVGPARLGLEGTAKAIALRLLSGQVDAEVAHRAADETFAVITPELRVEVRGTHFTVGAASGKSWVRVDEEARRGHARERRASLRVVGRVAGVVDAASAGDGGIKCRRAERGAGARGEFAARCAAEPARVARGLRRGAAPVRDDRARGAREHAYRRSGAGVAPAGRRRRSAARGAREERVWPRRRRRVRGRARISARGSAARGRSRDRRRHRRLSAARWSRRAGADASERALRRGRAGSAPRTDRARPRRLRACAGGRAARRWRASRCSVRWTARPPSGTTPTRLRWRAVISPPFQPASAPRARVESPTASALEREATVFSESPSPALRRGRAPG